MGLLSLSFCMIQFLILNLHLYLCACSVSQSSLTLCDPMDCSLPGSSVRWILQVRILEGIAISSSRGSSWPKDRTHVYGVSCISRWILYHWTTWKAHLYLCLYLFCLSVLFIWRTLKHTTNSNLKIQSRDLPGGPVVKNLHFHCREHRFDPWSGN